ncbi:nucleotidyltransferase family protein [Georgenia daeguensis]|uniref:2-nitropropane dioxygenase n=1 Tax=Georgenia daeguensis TaxID=908355 RepID=A0ABP8EU48_9MICO
MKPTTDVPRRARVRLAHAAVQHVADACAADILHLKGAAIDPALPVESRTGTDADVLVRPSQVSLLLGQMQRHGWVLRTTFRDGSPFEHAATLSHSVWGFADVHRIFPGITAPPDRAFETLWSGRAEHVIAGRSCPVPSQAAQATILTLNAARSHAHGRADLEAVWQDAGPERRREIRALVGELGAEVALAAATGALEDHRGDREYALWRVTTQGGTRIAEWRARIAAAGTGRQAVRLALRAPLVNVAHLEARLGRTPNRLEVLREFVARPVRGIAEEITVRRERRGVGRTG